MINKRKVVIGTWPLSGDFGDVSLSQIEKSIQLCLDLDFREFDTAPSYGNGFIEHCLGRIIANRNDIVINTKVGNLPFRGKDFSCDALETSLNESLKRLRIDKIGTLFLHNPRSDLKEPQKVIDWMQNKKEEGIISFMGLSVAKNFDYDPQFIQAFDVIQNDANLLYLKGMRKIKKYQGIKFVARSPLASGILSGKLSANSTFSNRDHRSSWLKGERLNSLVKRCNIISKTTDIPLSSLAKRFLLNQPDISQVIFGVKSPDHVLEIDVDVKAPPIDQKLTDQLIKLHDEDFSLVNEEKLGY